MAAHGHAREEQSAMNRVTGLSSSGRAFDQWWCDARQRFGRGNQWEANPVTHAPV
jgi:hypothetical protein